MRLDLQCQTSIQKLACDPNELVQAEPCKTVKCNESRVDNVVRRLKKDLVSNRDICSDQFFESITIKSQW